MRARPLVCAERAGRPWPLARRRGRRDVQVDVEPGLGRELEAALPHVLRRSRPAAVADLREEARTEEDPVQEHGNEELLDVLRRHVAARMEYRPGAGCTVQCQ